VVMLNVDLHNTAVEKKMTLQQFVRNNRGINDGKDFPLEFIATIYSAIAREQLSLIPARPGSGSQLQSPTGLAETHRWLELLKGSRKVVKEYLGVNECGCVVAGEAFRLVWGPLVATISALFDAEKYEQHVQAFGSTASALGAVDVSSATDFATSLMNGPPLLASALSGCHLCAMLAQHHQLPNVLDNLTITLAKFTNLSARSAFVIETTNQMAATNASKAQVQATRSAAIADSLAKFARSNKNQHAAVALFQMAQRYGSVLQDGWNSVVSCIVGLHILDLLSDEVLPFKPDFAGATAKDADGEPEKNSSTAVSPQKTPPARSSSGFFSLLSGGSWFQAAEPEHQVTEEERAHRKLGRECAARCELPALVAASAQLPVEALQILVKTLIHASTPKHLRDELLAPNLTSTAANTATPSSSNNSPNDSASQMSGSSTASMPLSDSVGAKLSDSLSDSLDSSSQLVLAPAGGSESLATSSGAGAGAHGKTDLLLLDSSVHTFCLEYLCNVVLLNRHRILYVWVMTSDHLLRIISNANSPVALLHKAVLCILLLCVQLLPTCNEDGLESEVVRALELLLRDLPVEARRTLAPKIGLALSLLVEEVASDHLAVLATDGASSSRTSSASERSHSSSPQTAVRLLSPRVWRAVFGLMSSCAIHPIAADRCFRALTALSHAWCSSVSSTGTIERRDSGGDTAPTLPAQPSSPSTNGSSVLCDGSNFASLASTLLAFARSTDCGPSLSIRALDLLYALYSSTELRPRFRASSDGSIVWQQIVAPLIEGLHLLCTDSRRPVRLAALTHLHRALLLPELQKLAPVTWMPCFDQVLLPLLQSTCRAEIGEQTRLRACTLLSGVFLQYLPQLSSAETFARLWMRVLYALERQSAVATSDGLLAEALPELVKNLLLVATSLGFFPVAEQVDATVHDDRWLHTWDLACRIAPSLSADEQLRELLKQNRVAAGTPSTTTITTPPLAAAAAAPPPALTPSISSTSTSTTTASSNSSSTPTTFDDP